MELGNAEVVVVAVTVWGTEGVAGVGVGVTVVAYVG